MAKKRSSSGNNTPFSRKRSGLFKKAKELSILCGSEIGVIIISEDGQKFEFASSSMQRIIKKFHDHRNSRNHPELRVMPRKPQEVAAVRKEVQDPKLKKWKLLGNDLTRTGFLELHALEEKLTEGMLQIKDRKMQILMEEIEQHKMHQAKGIGKHAYINFLPSTSNAAPVCIHNGLETERTAPPTADDLDTTLTLGLIIRKQAV